MQGQKKEIAWRLEDGKSFVFNAEVWEKRPLPIRIWCSRCNKETDKAEVHCLESGIPIECTDSCPGCGKKLKTTVVFRDYRKPVEMLVVPPVQPKREVIRTAFLRWTVVLPPLDPIGSDPIVLKDGKILIWDHRALPVRKEVTIECKCGGHSHPFVVCRDYRSYEEEVKALKEAGSTGIGFLRLLSLHGYMQGHCNRCHRQIEATIKLDY